MDSLQINISNEIDALIKETNVDTLNTTSHNIYCGMVEKLGMLLNDDFGELSKSILSLPIEDFENTIAKHEDYRRIQQKRILDLRLKLVGLVSSTSKEPSSSSTATRAVEME